MHILSAKNFKPEVKKLDGSSRIRTKIGQYELKFTLANMPTNGAYLFDVEVKFGNEGLKQIVGISIKKRKVKQIFKRKINTIFCLKNNQKLKTKIIHSKMYKNN